MGRLIAFAHGWYEQRRWVQFGFVLAVAGTSIVIAIALIVGARKAPYPAWLAMIGIVSVLAFITVRAASFHHFDELISSRVLGLNWNWILEMGGILIVLIASEWRRRATPPSRSASTNALLSRRCRRLAEGSETEKPASARHEAAKQRQ